MSIFAPNFLTGSNIANVLRQVSINGICAIGMTFVILTGGIDLSVGAIIGAVSYTHLDRAQKAGQAQGQEKGVFSGRRRIGGGHMHDHGSDGHGHTGETGVGNGRNRAGTDKAGNNRAG